MTAKSTRFRRPVGGWKDAVALGKKLEAIRHGYGLTQKEAAAELGISLWHYRKVEQGLFLPRLWLQDRLLNWAPPKHKTYSSNAKRDRQRDTTVKRGTRYPLRIRYSEYTQKRLERVTQRMGLTKEEFCLIAIDRLLDQPHEIVTLQDAMDRLEKVKVEQALQECSELRHFLQSDLQLCRKMGATVVEQEASVPETSSRKEAAQTMAPALRLVDEGSPWEIFGDD